jgi:hypothetical protein
MSETVCRLRAFGVLREVADPEGWIEIPSGNDLSVAELRGILQKSLQERHPGFDAEAILDCAIADENEILPENARIRPGDRELAILPPVCGG